MTASNLDTSNDTSVHYAAIERHAPAWLKGASAPTFQRLRDLHSKTPAWFEKACQNHPLVAKALAEAHAQHRAHETAVNALFEHLPNLESFATQRLHEGINTRFGLDIDINATYLVDARLITDELYDARLAINQATRSLLQCALHNFDADAAAPDGMDAPKALLKKSVVLDHRRFMGTVPLTNVVDIDPQAFAELCRTLDIGGEYHKLLHTVYFPGTQPEQEPQGLSGAVYDTLAQAEASALRQSLHFAFLKGDISQALYTAALAAPLEAPLTSGQAAVSFSTLTLWEAELFGVTLIHLPESGPEQPGSIALYKPDDGESPVKEFASFDALKRALRDTLLKTPTYLDGCLAEKDKSSTQLKLKDRLTPFAWSIRGIRERVADPSATLEPVPHAILHPVLGTLVARKVDRHEQDILFRAVPTEVVDRRSAIAHRNAIIGDVLTALNIAGFVVPGLGEVMLAVCITQLAYEVYEGIESWAIDDKQQARSYLVDVLENVATLAAWAAAGYVIKKGIGAVREGFPQAPILEVPTIETPSFIEELEEVELPDGQRRLWKPDLDAFADDTILPNDLMPDDTGVYHYAGRRWLVLEGTTYAIKESSSPGQYQIAHPSKPLSYEPPLRHNGAGAWLHPLDRPEQWQALTLFRRAAHTTAQFDDETAQRILRVSDTSEDSLRHVLRENQRLPGTLQDTLSRFELDRKLAKSLPLASPSEVRSQFDRQYRSLPKSTQPGAGIIGYRYAQLPVAVIEEVLRNASQAEMLELQSDKVPLRLAEEIRLLQQQVRLNRAYEGLYLDGLRNWDSDCLVLHTLERLPGWSSDITLELEQGLYSPKQSTRIGTGAAHASIVSAHAGYVVEYSDTPEQAPFAHETLYDALFEVLTPAQREALGSSDARALKASLQHQPLLPRDRLREVLGMQPIRPDFRSPMRLANGRLGYPLGGLGAGAGVGVTRNNLLALIRQIGLPEHTARSATAVLGELEAHGLSRQQIDTRLRALLDERQALQSHLEAWRHQQEAAGANDAQALDQLASTLMQHWYGHALPELGDAPTALRLERTALQAFPQELPSPTLARVTHLQLVDSVFPDNTGWSHLERLLQQVLRQFPNVRTLLIDRPYAASAAPSPMLFSLPLIAHLLPQLENLTFTHQNIPLSATDIDSLRALTNLRRLDLSGNRLSQRYAPVFNQLSLDYLGLERFQLDHWPEGLGSLALERIGEISLRENGIRLLPSFLLNDDIHSTAHPNLFLQGNPILDDHVQQVLLRDDSRLQRVHLDVHESVHNSLGLQLTRRQALRQSLDRWSNASSSTASPSAALVAARQSIGGAILEFWRNQERGLSMFPLRLQQVALEHFPPELPRFFTERVRSLVLSRTRGSTAQMDAFFARFPNTTRLEIDEHQQAQASLVSALLRLPALTELELGNLGLEVNQALLDSLAPLSNLTALNLTGNRMGVIDAAPQALQRLTRLDLSNMGLEQWPVWVDALLPLPLLDLSDNRLTALPENILNNPEHQYPISSISLFGNPMSNDMVARARASSDSQHSYTFALDIPGDLLPVSSDEEPGHHHAPLPSPENGAPNPQDWLYGNSLQNEGLQETWEGLEQAGNAEPLLALVGRLRRTGTYNNREMRADFCERVRKMLARALANPDDRMIFNALAEEALPNPQTGDQTCLDGALLVFQNIEMLIANHQFIATSADSQDTLYNELRRLFRLQTLDDIARERLHGRDAVEVRLAYRQDLNVELGLALPNDDMLYRAHANVSRAELETVQKEVNKRETSEAFLIYAADNKDWVRYLRHTYAERFADIEAHYQAEVEALPDRHPDLPLEALEQDFKALEDEKKAREQRLVHELTILANPHRS